MSQPISPELIVYGLTMAGEPQVSPDGSRILYTLAKTDAETKKGGSQVWLCDLDGSNARQLTWTGQRNGGGVWSADGTRVAFVSDRVKESGIFVLELDRPGEAREVTRHNQAIGSLAWSPDGTRIAYTTLYDPENPDETPRDKDAPPKVRVTRRIDYKQDGRGYLGDLRFHTFVVDVESGERRRLSSELRDHIFPQWSPDGSIVSSEVTYMNGMWSYLALLPADGGEAKRVGPEDGSLGVWAWSPSGDRIIYSGNDEHVFQDDFFVYDVASGTSKRLTDDLAVNPAGGEPGRGAPSQPVWLDDRQVLFHALRAGGSGLYTIDAESGGVEPVVRWQAMHGGLSVDGGKRYAVQGRVSLSEIGEIAVYDLQSGETSVITGYNTATLEEHPPAKWESFQVERAGHTIDAWLLMPPDFDPSKRYPVILDVHGGPQGFYGYGFTPWQQILATNGFLVAMSNPRGSGSYGREFAQAVLQDWGGEDFKDLMLVLDTVLERPYADRERTGIWGYSYGGYMTSWTIGQTDRFQAAVCGAPCFDLESMYGTSDISHIFGELEWGGQPYKIPEKIAAQSPSTFAHRATTPTLIIQGEADERCPVGQAEQMYIALQKAGCEVEFARYPGGSHGMLRLGPPEHRVDVFGRILGWFKDHLGDPA